ncbi:hypothetical protein [Streptomyces brasiliensis]|uniref:Uncharacterized protein n=1 Tax=Streptomyces brasiliensis TaxID=1954 RepID=A0A917P9V8_9ACTN|nr:hypothetical protein [Streptomyces brasiliensis]GGJ68050.1 hypothetical protein GCM10010121_093460 [Streptomyces brasiliensis]
MPGPWRTTGRLYDADRIPFTIGVCGTGELYIRNDAQGDSAHLPFPPTSDLAALGQHIADLIGDLY